MSNTLSTEGKTIRIALAGNPNAGKTTIFNELTGGRAHVGNWPGVTVEKKEGRFKYKNYEFLVTDLPGIYSLTAYSIDERIARNYVAKEKLDVVVSVTDSTNLERNLYLLVSFLEFGVNSVLDLNMADILEEKKVRVDTKKMEELLGVPVVMTSATKKAGLEELKETIINSKDREIQPLRIDYSKEIEETIEKIAESLSGINSPYPTRFLSIKLLEGDIEIIKEVKELGYGGSVEVATHEASKLETRFGYDIETEIIERRYGFIESIVRQCVRRVPTIEEKVTASDRIDGIVTNKWLGIPIFAFLLWATFQLTFTVGGFFADFIDTFFGWIAESSAIWLALAGAPGWLSSLVGDGIISGVGAVFVFLPNILILFIFLSFLEDVGYMSRAAFIMDKAMHAIGLPGKSFIPMILGFGCNVPAIMSARTISSEKDRLLTILINPFISCSARLPVYVMFTGIFFKSNQGVVVFSLYMLGIIVAVFSAKLFKSTIPRLKGPVSPLVMELPPYRIPTLKGVLIHAWERGKEFLKKAGTIIFAGVILIWLLASFPMSAEYASETTLIGYIGKFFAPLFKPAGFPFWQAAVALLFGIIAKEIVVGTFGTLFGGEGALSVSLLKYFTPLSAYSFMVMSLLYIPCVAAIGVIYRETSSWKWTTFITAYSLVIGWLLATVVYRLGSLFI